MIKNGNIAYELARPINIFTLFFSKTLAWRISNSFVRLIPIMMINTILLPMTGLTEISLVCTTWHNIGCFLISIVIAYVLSSLITVFLYSISLLLTVATNFIGFFNSIAMLLTGTIIPLNYFPTWMRTILEITPFKGIIDTPAMILTGEYSLEKSYFSIIGQVLWCVLLLIINKLIIRISIKRLVIQGG